MRTQYDGINADADGIHRQFPDAEMIAYYLDGQYAWTSGQEALWPESTERVSISVQADSIAGDVLDVENGDATPGQARGWIAARKAAGLHRPTIYCSESTVPAVRAATGSYILGADYDIWVALFDGSTGAPVPPGLPAAKYVAKQYLATAGYDVSAVYDDGWPHRTPPGPAAPSVTAWSYADVSWTPGKSNVVQLRLANGEMVTDTLQASSGHWQTRSFPPGAIAVRVQVDGVWSPWRTA